MTKHKNIEVEVLERRLKVICDELAKLRANPPNMPFEACSASCILAKFGGGVSTNGGCRCIEDKNMLRRAATYWRAYAIHCNAVIDELKKDISKLENFDI